MSLRRTARRARKSGTRWEAQVGAENSAIALSGQAFVFQVPENSRVLRRRGGVVQGHMEKATFVDFAGYTKDGARFIAFDAKHTTAKTSWPFPGEDHPQRRWLSDVVACGGVGFFYLSRYIDGPGRISVERYVLPVSPDGVVAEITGRKSFPFSDPGADLWRLGAGDTWWSKLKSLGIV